MNRIAKLISSASVLAVLVCGTALPAFAGGGEGGGAAHAEHKNHNNGHHKGASLLREAASLPSLSASQRADIQKLEAEQAAQRAPVHAARGAVLQKLATQVEAGKIDRAALAPELQAQTQAKVAERSYERTTVERLHALLTPAQRAELVAKIEAAGGGGNGKALEAFKQDRFAPPPVDTAKATERVEAREAQFIDRIEAKLPTMNADERAKTAAHLRAMATR